MNREFLIRLSKAYKNKALDLSEAIEVWKESKLTADDIQLQVHDDIGLEISHTAAENLLKVGCEGSKMDGLVDKNPTLGKSKRKLPVYLEKDERPTTIKFNSKSRNEVIKVGENKYRSKFASKYWTLKEKVGKDGKRELYLVAIEDEDIKR